MDTALINLLLKELEEEMLAYQDPLLPDQPLDDDY